MDMLLARSARSGSCFPPTGPVSDWISQGSVLDCRSENIILSYAGSNDNCFIASLLPSTDLFIGSRKKNQLTPSYHCSAIDVFRFYLLVCSDSGRASMSTADTSVTEHNIAIIALVAKQKTQGDKLWTSMHS